MIRHALLALLREQPDYGYRLKQRFDERVGCAWRLNVGQVYQTLHALAHAGLIREVQTAASPAPPARRVFAITTKGSRALDRWLRRPVTPLRPVRDALLLRLLCLEPRQYGTVLAELDLHERACRHRLEELRIRRARVMHAGRCAPIALLALAAEMLQLARQVEWLGSSGVLRGARAARS